MIEADEQTSADIIRTWAERSPEAIATCHRSGEVWVSTTWSALWVEVQRGAASLTAQGLRAGDRLAILARTCREWQVAEQAATLAGATVVGIDPHASPPQVAWILQHTAAEHLLVENIDVLTAIPTDARDRLRSVAVFVPPPEPRAYPGLRVWHELLAPESRAPSSEPRIPSREFRAPSPESIAVLIYTSGTTGAPKGIEYTHRQLALACRAMMEEFPDLRQRNRFICWLPMAALFQRMINLVAMASGSTTYFVEDPREIMARVRDVKPTVFFSVPRFYEKLHDGIRAQLAAQSGVRRRLANEALRVGAEYQRLRRDGVRPGWWLALRHALVDRLVLRRIRAAMGGEMGWMITGSAAAPIWLLEFFHSVGLLLLEAYGITENPVPLAANRPQRYRLGSVGLPFAMNDLRLSAQHEVLVKGPAVFRGYRGETSSEDLFTPDGYYRTGDLGRIDADGFLFLTGRLAELIKTSTGRRISPATVEGTYRQSRYVDQIVVVGNNRPYLTALVSVNELAMRAALAAELGSLADLAASESARAVLQADLSALAGALARPEQVQNVRIVPEPFTVEGGLMTPTLKLRRDRIAGRYAGLIDEMYKDVQSAGPGRGHS